MLTKLESLKVEHADGNSYIDLATLSSAKLPPNMDKFLFAIATAEGMTKLQWGEEKSGEEGEGGKRRAIDTREDRQYLCTLLLYFAK